MDIKVVLSFGNRLFSEGIRKMLEEEKNISVEVLDSNTEHDIGKLKSMKPDVILTDFITLHNAFVRIEDASQQLKVLFLDTNCSMDNHVSAVLKKKVHGILLNNNKSDVNLLKDAIRTVAKGDLWFDRTLDSRTRTRLINYAMNNTGKLVGS